jgi:hypothetical protein
MDNNKMDLIMNDLLKEVYSTPGGKESIFMRTLELMQAMMFRIKQLECKSDPMPFIANNIPFSPFMGLPQVTPEKIDRALTDSEKDIFEHLLSKGCSKDEAAAIAREMEEIAHVGGGCQ